MRSITTNPATLAALEEMRDQMRVICQPQYHEFHRTTVERGFTKITLPKAKAREA